MQSTGVFLTPQNHILLTVVCTIVSATLWGNVPYFPTEISRNAASGVIPLTIFRFGFFTLIFTLLRANALTWTTFMLWISLVLIAAFDDFNYIFLHSVGVGSLIVSAACNVYYYKWNAGIIPFCSALLIYGMRGLMKVLTVTYAEMASEEISNITGFYTFFCLRHSKIMYTGAKGCFNAEMTIPVFKFAGVLQWAILYGFMLCF